MLLGASAVPAGMDSLVFTSAPVPGLHKPVILRAEHTMIFRKAFGRTGRIVPPRPLPSLQSAFATRRAIFGVLDLREDRISAASHLAEDLSPAARRALREGEPV